MNKSKSSTKSSRATGRPKPNVPKAGLKKNRYSNGGKIKK